MRKKVIYITNKAPHYRIALWNSLAKDLDIKFLFTHEKGKIKNLKAKHEHAKGFGIGKYKIHFSLIFKALKERPDKVVLLPPDPLHLIDNLLCFFALRIKKCPFSFFVERWEYKNKPLKQKICEPIYRKLLRKANSIIVCGTKSREWVLKQGVKKEKVFLSLDINPSISKNLSIRKRKPLKMRDKKIVLYIGRLIRRKGIDYLIRSFRNLSIKIENALLIIVGGGDFYQLGARSEEFKLKQLVKKLNLQSKVVFTGPLPYYKIKKYYRMADVFVCPSVTTNIGEPWGFVIEEAMSFGLPIIATDAVGSAYDLIENGKNGFVIPEKNIRELTKAIKKILEKESLRKKMGKESKKRIAQYLEKKDFIKSFIEALLI